ncbi:MAG: glycosyltransferase [Isosphaeraceae bacterium]
MGIEEELLAQLEEKEKWIAQIEQSLADYVAEVDDLQLKVKALEGQLRDATSAKAYRLASFISRTIQRIAPPETRRRRLLRLGYRALKVVSKLRHPHWVVKKVVELSQRLGGKLNLMLARRMDVSGNLLGRGLLEPLDFHNLPRFVTHDHVDVSIVIPVFNHYRESLACIRSIALVASHSRYEVIVVDDGSTDETPEMLRRVRGLVLLRNDQNLGFIGSCNRGASAARGEFLVFLNNDTIVTPGWLEALRETFQEVPDAGYVGAKLVYPDGRLQEAGSVIWNDASGWNYGKLDNPDHPSYNFMREVDYCSGACIMVPRELFQELGGFDSHYAPAYYDDTDIAFKIRQRGRKVVYQPLAKIIHHEGLTSGTSLESGVKAYQRVNQAKFRQRWSDRLDAHAPAPPQDADRNAYTRSLYVKSRVHVLVIDARIIMPDRDSGSLRMLGLLRAIRQMGYHVTFLPSDMVAAPPYLQSLQRIGIEVIHHPFYCSAAHYLKEHGRELDLVILSRADVATSHMTSVRRFAPQARVVFDTVDLHFVREDRQARIAGDHAVQSVTAPRKQQEIRLARRADLTLVVSHVEKAILEEECPGLDVQIISTIHQVDVAEPPGFENRRNIVFIGSFEHPPNPDAVLFFVREIFPLIQNQLRDVVFQVIGPNPPWEIEQLASPAVKILGFVPEVKPIFDRARVSVAPLRFGAGVKGKINQSMAFGVPAIVTSIAAEGMYLVHEQNAMIADDPRAFADAVVRAYNTRDLWERLSRNGRKSVRTHFSVEAASQRVGELMKWAGLSSPIKQLDEKTVRAHQTHGFSGSRRASVISRRGSVLEMCSE